MLLAKRIKMILFFGIVFSLLSFGGTLFFPLQYRADAQIFIISQSRQGVDPYTTIKSAERIGENIAELLKTDDFFQKVMSQPDYAIDQSQFIAASDRQRRKQWKKTVTGSVVYGTGVFTVSAYHRDPAQAIALSGAAAQTIVSYGWQYVGGDVTIKLVNPPVATQFPVRPNIILNTIAGFIAGCLFMSIMILRKGK